MVETSKRAEAERCLGIAEKLLMARDLLGSKKFAFQAQESDPLFEGSDQILAVADVLLAAEQRINNHLDWYAILQVDRQSEDLELIKKQYRRLALLLHPDKNKFVFSDKAFKLVSDAWAVLSNPEKKSLYDNELNLFSKLAPIASTTDRQQEHVRPSPRNNKRKASDGPKSSSGNACPLPLSSFWTACPYCYFLYEYPRIYEDCCLRCQNCQRAFHASLIPSPPPMVPGKEAYFCCWGFFPLGFSMPNLESGHPKGFPNWMPFSPMFQSQTGEEKRNAATPKTSLDDGDSLVEISEGSGEACGSKKKGGRGVGASSSRNVKNSQAEKNPAGQARRDSASVQDGFVMAGVQGADVPHVGRPTRKKTVAKNTRKQMGRGGKEKKNETKLGQGSMGLDLNVEDRNEGGDDTPTTSERMEAGSQEEAPTEGTGFFFEGLDDILNSLPILSVVEEEKVKAG